ncbi:MAG: triosephosphate isomerase [Candidatus Levybacteria bacterium]|nr:triosephosphate isomerase [Candidatus Levybacteria bacterium]
MKKLFLVANWKEHKTLSEAHQFMISFLGNDLLSYLAKNVSVDRKIILCPSFILLPELAGLLHEFHLSGKIKLGAQNISPYPDGPHTGEVSARQIAEFASYVIIGHSERRREYNESDEILEKKVSAALEQNITPIFCVSDKDEFIPSGVTLVAYEPVDAIGTGSPDDPKSAQAVASYIKEKKHIHYVLYGGSVTSRNVDLYIQQPDIDGVLVGGASLDPVEFSQIIQNANPLL